MASLTEAAAIAAAWARDDREMAERAVSDAMIDATSVSGTPDQCRARIEAYRQSGIDVAIISPFARGPDASARFAATIRACAPASLIECAAAAAETSSFTQDPQRLSKVRSLGSADNFATQYCMLISMKSPAGIRRDKSPSR